MASRWWERLVADIGRRVRELKDRVEEALEPAPGLVPVPVGPNSRRRRPKR